MADFSKELHDRITQAGAISALISTRLYPDRLPDAVALPAVIYNLLPGGWIQREHGEQAGLFGYAIQFDCWASTHLGASTLENTIFTEIDGTRGAWGNIQVQGCMATGNPIDLSDPETGISRITREYLIVWR